MRFTMVKALVIAALTGFSFAVQAQTKWDMPTPYSDGEFHTVNVKLFAADVRKATNNQLDINVHSNGSLIKHPDMLRAVSTGQVNVVELLLGQFGNEDPVFAADNVPFVATGYDRSGSANLNSAISGNSGHDAGPRMVWRKGVFDGQEIRAA